MITPAPYTRYRSDRDDTSQPAGTYIETPLTNPVVIFGVVTVHRAEVRFIADPLEDIEDQDLILIDNDLALKNGIYRATIKEHTSHGRKAVYTLERTQHSINPATTEGS